MAAGDITLLNPTGAYNVALRTPSTNYYVQNNGNAALGGTTVACTFYATSAPGNLIVVYAACTGGAITGISDSVGNTYHTAATISSQEIVYYAWNITADPSNPITITVTQATAGASTLFIHEFTGIQNTSDPLDDSNTASGSSTSALSASTTASKSGDLVFAVWAASSGNVITPSGGATLMPQFNSIGTVPKTQYQIAPNAGTVTAAGTLASNDNWQGAVVAFKTSGLPMGPVVQWAQRENTGLNTAFAFNAENTYGNTIVLFAMDLGNSVIWSSVTDTAGNTYTPGASVRSGNGSCWVYYCVGCKGGPNSVTFTNTGGSPSFPAIYMFELAGVTAYDNGAANDGNSATSSTGNFTTNYSDLIVSTNILGGTCHQPAPGYNLLEITPGFGDALQYWTWPAGTQTVDTPLDGGSGAWVAAAAAFKLVNQPAPPPPRNQPMCWIIIPRQ